MKPEYITVLLFLVIIACNKPKLELESLSISNSYVDKIEYPENYQVQSVYYYNNEFLSYNNSKPELKVYDLRFNLVSEYNKSGFGPGEFQKIDSAVMTTNRIFVYDSVKKSIEIFDRGHINIGSIPTDHKIISLVAQSDSIVYAGVLGMKQNYIVKLEGSNLENETIIYAKDIDDLLMGFHSLSIHGQDLFIANIMTNTGVILNLENGKKVDFVNSYMEKQPEFVYQGEYKLPKKPVWRVGLISENHLFQLKNLNSGESLIYRVDYDGNVTKKFMFDEQIASIISTKSEFWIFTGTSLFKYDLKLFTD